MHGLTLCDLAFCFGWRRCRTRTLDELCCLSESGSGYCRHRKLKIRELRVLLSNTGRGAKRPADFARALEEALERNSRFRQWCGLIAEQPLSHVFGTPWQAPTRNGTVRICLRRFFQA